MIQNANLELFTALFRMSVFKTNAGNVKIRQHPISFHPFIFYSNLPVTIAYDEFRLSAILPQRTC